MSSAPTGYRRAPMFAMSLGLALITPDTSVGGPFDALFGFSSRCRTEALTACEAGSDCACKDRVDASARHASRRSAKKRAQPQALDENLEAIKRWEQAALHDRTAAEHLSDRVISVAASGRVLAFHVVWFVTWTVLNLGLIADVRPFDPFPFPLLTITVSLEAIFLTLFVLASQNRLARQADKRAHLDLQIDLLAEREMTVVLRLLQDIARDLHVRVSVTPEQIRDLVKQTDIHELTDRMEEIPEDGKETESPSADVTSPARPRRA